MNKARIVGLILLLAAVIIYFYFENDVNSFLGGFLGGAGLIFLLTGKFVAEKQ